MNESPTRTPDNPPPSSYVHDDGRICHYRPYWVGNVRDGHWEYGYWYAGEFDTWRWCGEEHN